ncbi:hydrolase [Chlamydia sp. 04-14]|uniref:hydrolase n=1 Tax=Chlamydia TaxID=810 RepID=UPI002FC6E214
MKNIIKDIKAQNSGKAIPEDQIQFSCGGDGVTENAMRKPWNVSSQRITNIARGSGNPASGSIALKSDLSDYLQKGGVTTRGIFLRTTGGLMIGDINMGTNNTIVGLPTSYKTTIVNDNDIASVGMVSEDIGSLAAKVTDLIDRINNLSSANGLDKIIKDLGTPSNGNVTKPKEAKWLVRAGGNSMTGNLGFQKSEQSTPTDPEPTIKDLAITGSVASGVSAVGAISTATPKDNLQRIVAVNDVLETLSTIKTNTTYPKWTGMDVSFVCLKQGANSSSSTDYEKSKNADKYITTVDANNVTLLRRGIYCVSFIYDFTQPTPPTTPPATPTPATDVSCALSITPKGGTKTECYKMTGKSDTTLIGKTYIFVEGTQASTETTLSFEVTSTPAVAKRTWTVSFVGAAY